MANENGDKSPQPPAHEPELLPAMMAIALAVVAQLALQDGLTLLGLAGYFVAAWLFVASVRGLSERLPGPASAGTPQAETETAEALSGRPVASANRLAYLRRNWRLLTLAEIFRGDIPPARLQGQEISAPGQVEPADEPQTSPARAAPDLPASPSQTIKVTLQGDVLVLDSDLAQVQRFDARGQLLATYPAAELAGLEIADLAIAPDGRTLYVVDATSSRLRVITLADDQQGGEEE